MSTSNLAALLVVSISLVGQTVDSKNQCAKSSRPRDSSWHHRYINDYGPGEARNLSGGELKRLRVEWDEPWVDSDRWDSRLIISGRVLIASEDGSEIRPMDWTQPVTVVLARRPDVRLDWSRGYADEDSDWSSSRGDETSLWCDALVNWHPEGFRRSDDLLLRGNRDLEPTRMRDGSFRVSFPLSRFRRPVGTTKPYQVGLSVGRIAYWSNQIPVMPQSVSMLNVTGPPRLSPTLQMINEVPTPGGYAHDSVALIRAVNHLRSLEKPRVIEALREFLSFAKDNPLAFWELRDPANSDVADEDSLELLIPLLFERIDPREKLPAGGPRLRGWLLLEKIKKGEPLPTKPWKPEKGYLLMNDEWPMDEITIWQGIPFQNGAYSPGGLEPLHEGPRVPATTYLVDWAEDRAKLIKGRLRPTDDPLAAADALFEHLVNERRLDDHSKWKSDNLRSHLRFQAWRMVASLVEPERANDRSRFDEPFHSDIEWAQLKEKVKALGIHWDETRQKYVTKKPRLP